MCQRIMIAMALACEPQLLIADEPTTGIDVTTQAVIMDLVAELGRSRGMATLLITHDLGLAAELLRPHRGDACRPRRRDRHRWPSCSPRRGTPTRRSCWRRRRARIRELIDLAAIPGNLPDLRRADLPPCRYSKRCERRLPACEQPLPSLIEGRHTVACWNPL